MKLVQKLLSIPLAYLLTSWVARIIFSSLVVFVVLSTQTRDSRMVEIMEENSLLAAGLGSIAFLGLMFLSYPLVQIQKSDFFRGWKNPGLKFIVFGGLFIGVMPQLLLFMGGSLNFWGIHSIPNESWELSIRLISQAMLILLLVFPEEWIYRQKTLANWLDWIERPLLAVLSVAIIATVIRWSQFPSIHTHELIVNLLTQVSMGMLYLLNAPFLARVGGIWLFYVAHHVLFSAPLFGTEFAGLFLLKPTYEVSRLSGGSAGPLASFLVMAMLIWINWRLWIRFKKSNFKIE